MRLICVTGMPGCGKEEFVKVAEENGLKVVRMGDIVRTEAMKRNLEFSDDSVGGLANEERLKHGYSIWAERTIPHIEGDVVVVDGIRCPEELEVFRNKLAGVEISVLAIHSSPETRRKRLISRARSDDVLSQEEFKKRDERELKWGICTVIALVDHVIVNEGSVDELRANAAQFLKDQDLVD